MCGLAGRFAAAGLKPDPGWRQRASRLLVHRGPDGDGDYADEHCELVHRRLALIDLTPTGAQPMTNEDGSVLVVYNGEIFNHRELRDKLRARGHRFRGTSDTEVLVHGWEEYGIELCAQLRGQFAFAVYDRRRRSLLLARDRFGIKPLFYAHHGSDLVFASEIKAITAATGFVPELDRQACYDYLGLSYVPEPATGFLNICALDKGTAMLVDERGTHVTQFASIRAREQPTLTLSDAVSRVERSLLAATASQSVADVPIAALLSGGIDSSLVVAGLCRATKSNPITFNVAFPDRAFDETHVARAVATHYGTDHRTIEVANETLRPDTLVDLLAQFDQPFSDESLIPTYQVCQAIRATGIKCTLSGDGGDEAFGGYPPFWNLHAVARLMQLPSPVHSMLSSAGARLASHTQNLGRQVVRATGLAAAARLGSAELLGGFSSYLSPAQKRELVRAEARVGLADVPPSAPRYTPASTSDLDELSRRMTEYYFAQSLPSHMLRKVDIMSMRASLEVRVPMLDEDLVDVGLSLTHALKTDGRRGKLVLRELANSWLPREVARHPKHGFAMPLDRMVDHSFHELLGDTLLGPTTRLRGFDLTVVDTWISLFRTARTGELPGTISREGLYQRILNLLALERWLDRFGLSW